MKKIIYTFILGFTICALYSSAQSPQAIPYQAVARDTSGNLITNHAVSLRFSIHAGSAVGTVVYKETQSAITNALGLFTVNVGQGTVVTGTFASVNWGSGNKFIQVELDATGGISYVDMGTQQMLSVPYALYAGNLPNGTSDGQILVWNSSTSQWVSTSICSLFNSTANCGSCGNVCGPYANAVAGCSGGSCSIVSCSTGFADCNAVVADGCEINITTNANNCGACGNVCSLSNAVAGCSSSTCTLISCNTGFKNCDGSTPNGCEININTDVLNCNGCGIVCSANNITRACSAGSCSGLCNSGFADCNSNKQTDGCEVSINTDPTNCGACGNFCSTNHITPACTAGSCSGSCSSGFADCDGNKLSNGCEVSINTDLNNCGGCGLICSANNTASHSCTAVACTGTCSSGFANCNNNFQIDGCEVSINADVNNCGSCGAVCSSNNISPACSAGSCTGMCNSGFADCNSNRRADGCEVNINSDPNNCGSCGGVCSSNNMATRTCSSSLCNGTCSSGFADCNGNKQADGCEVNIFTNVANCGGCGSTCSSNNITTPVCTAGACTGNCNTGFADCNSNKRTDGCEINTTSNSSNCGSCGHICPAGQTCSGSVCL